MANASDPAAIKARVVAHMNKDHAGELSLYLRAFNGLPASAAARPAIVDMTLDALVVRSASGTHTVAISPPLPNWAASRVRLVEMAQAALATLGLSDIKVDVYAAPAGLDCVVCFGVTLYFFCAATWGLVRPGSWVWDLLDAVFPYGAAAYSWLVKVLFVPVLAIHVAEAWWMVTTRLDKHRVESWSKVWWLWVVSTFFEGATAFRRFDRVVEKEKTKKEGLKH